MEVIAAAHRDRQQRHLALDQGGEVVVHRAVAAEDQGGIGAGQGIFPADWFQLDAGHGEAAHFLHGHIGAEDGDRAHSERQGKP